jgi:hypothetical protein
MPGDLIAVFDETGTHNVPLPDAETDFAIGGLIVEPALVPTLTKAAREIGQLVQSRDFKYKHVQRRSDARALFLRAINRLLPPSGTMAMYCAGGSLVNERLRTGEAVADVGGRGTAFSIEAQALGSDRGSLHIRLFLNYFAPCLRTYAGQLRRTIRVHWDKRSDLEALQTHCSQQGEDYKNHPRFGDISQSVSFDHVADGQLGGIGRLADVVAGDVRQFFRKHGARIWNRLKDEFGKQGVPADFDVRDNRQLQQLTRVATMEECLADRAYAEGSRETCMLQGYSKRFIENAISFSSPPGMMGHLRIENGSRWHIQQIPD